MIVLGDRGKFQRIGNIEDIADVLGVCWDCIGGHSGVCLLFNNSFEDRLKLNINNFFEMVFII